ncbi:NAD-dependent deacetylase sirtuin-1, partial [Trachymyrmex cornetzi]
GSFATASCTKCKYQVRANDIREDIFAQRISTYSKCRVNALPSSHVPQILINREQLPHLKFGVELLGDGDIIINQICHLMGDTYEEICWYDKFLMEVYPRLSQDSLSITMNVMPHHRTNDINVCVSSLHSNHVQAENLEETFNILEESPKRRSGDTSIENSLKRMNFDSTHETEVASSTSPVKVNTKHTMISSENKLHITYENNSEECQVVPTVLSLFSEAVISETTLESHKSLNKCGKSKKYDDVIAILDATTELDKTIPKPRQASVDSVLDSGIGDSCNSIDSTEEKFHITELKNRRLERHCWQSKIRESLATRLPENSYYQLAAFRYIFPDAEVYSEPEQYDQCSLSANSDSTDSDSDSSFSEEEEEEEDEEEETGKF